MGQGELSTQKDGRSADMPSTLTSTIFYEYLYTTFERRYKRDLNPFTKGLN